MATVAALAAERSATTSWLELELVAASAAWSWLGSPWTSWVKACKMSSKLDQLVFSLEYFCLRVRYKMALTQSLPKQRCRCVEWLPALALLCMEAWTISSNRLEWTQPWSLLAQGLETPSSAGLLC